jgi:hypothetical protein
LSVTYYPVWDDTLIFDASIIEPIAYYEKFSILVFHIFDFGFDTQPDPKIWRTYGSQLVWDEAVWGESIFIGERLDPAKFVFDYSLWDDETISIIFEHFWVWSTIDQVNQDDEFIVSLDEFSSSNLLGKEYIDPVSFYGDWYGEWRFPNIHERNFSELDN